MIKTKTFKPGRAYTRKDWDNVDNPTLTKEQMAKAKPFAETLPGLAKAIRRRAPGQPLDKVRNFHYLQGN